MSPREKLADALMEVDLRTLDFERMKQERDEAKEKYATEASEHMLAVNKICNERDKALEALMKIEDLFLDGTDIYADREKMGTIAKEALEEAK